MAFRASPTPRKENRKRHRLSAARDMDAGVVSAGLGVEGAEGCRGLSLLQGLIGELLAGTPALSDASKVSGNQTLESGTCLPASLQGDGNVIVEAACHVRHMELLCSMVHRISLELRKGLSSPAEGQPRRWTGVELQAMLRSSAQSAIACTRRWKSSLCSAARKHGTCLWPLWSRQPHRLRVAKPRLQRQHNET